MWCGCVLLHRPRLCKSKLAKPYPIGEAYGILWSRLARKKPQTSLQRLGFLLAGGFNPLPFLHRPRLWGQPMGTLHRFNLWGTGGAWQGVGRTGFAEGGAWRKSFYIGLTYVSRCLRQKPPLFLKRAGVLAYYGVEVAVFTVIKYGER